MSHSTRSTRHIALRAAIAVTGLVMPGCYDSSQNQRDSGPEPDAVVVADAACNPSTPPTTEAGCTACGFFWIASSSQCAVGIPGPFVPPSLEV